MNYQQAVVIARKISGATLTRDESGTFVVRAADGTVIAGPDRASKEETGPPTAMEELTHTRKEMDRKQAAIERLESENRAITLENELRLDGVQARFEHKIQELKSIEARLRGELSAANIQAEEQSKKIGALEAKNKKLQCLFERVSESERERLRAEDEARNEAEVRAKRALRRVVDCSCSGLAENCARCFGSGTYTVDGFGNRV